MMFKSKKKKQQIEYEAAINAFVSDYKEIVKKHGLDFGLFLEYTNKGIKPIAKVIKNQINEQPNKQT